MSKTNPNTRDFLPAIFVALCALAAALLACGDTAPARSFKEIKNSGKIVFITRNAPTAYYEDRDGSFAGIEYEMAAAFARHLGLEPEFKVIQSISGILDALANGEGDIAAAGLTHTAERANSFLMGPTYQKVQQLVVCRRGGARPKKVDDLSGVGIRVVARSSYEERLNALKETHPDLIWAIDDSLDTEQLLREVWLGNLDCTVSDDNIFSINRRYYPELISVFSMSDPEPLAWLLHRKSGKLKKTVDAWFDEFEASGELSQLIEKYYGYIEIFDYVDTRKFVRRIGNMLPRYRPLFEEMSDQTGLSWTLLAAQSYQESHWDPRAESPTGVKGIMMLTLPAAEDLGGVDRLDPEQSIRGGANYLSQLKRRLPKEIEEPDRTWIALAAYNVGISHLYDARGLARRLNKNPDRWKSLAEVLPLLAQRQYYKSLKHGYARGSEPVRYVNRIRDYEDILHRALDWPHAVTDPVTAPQDPR